MYYYYIPNSINVFIILKHILHYINVCISMCLNKFIRSELFRELNEPYEKKIVN